MDDFGAGQVRQRPPEFPHQPPHAGRSQRTALLNGLGEVQAGDVLGGRPQQRVVEPGTEQARACGVTTRACTAALPIEPPPELRAFGVFGPYHLHGGEPRAVVGRACQVDPAHATAAEQAERQVWACTAVIGRLKRPRSGLSQRCVVDRGRVRRRGSLVCHGGPPGERPGALRNGVGRGARRRGAAAAVRTSPPAMCAYRAGAVTTTRSPRRSGCGTGCGCRRRTSVRGSRGTRR